MNLLKLLKKKAVLLASGSLILICPLLHAQASSVTLKIQNEAIDLDTGSIVSGLLVSDSNTDFSIAYNSDRTPGITPSNDNQAEISLVSQISFSDFSAQDIANLTLSTAFQDQGLDNNSVVILRTKLNQYFKLGNFSVDNANSTVTFDYEKLQ